MRIGRKASKLELGRLRDSEIRIGNNKQTLTHGEPGYHRKEYGFILDGMEIYWKLLNNREQWSSLCFYKNFFSVSITLKLGQQKCTT